MKISINKIKINRIKFASILTGIGVFITGSCIRYGIYNNVFFKQHSFIFYLGLFFIYYYSQKGRNDISTNSFEKVGLFLSLIVITTSVIIIFMDSGFLKLNPVLSMIIPIFTISFTFRSSKGLKEVLSVWMHMMSFCVIIMLITIIFDLFTNFSFTKWLANFTGITSFTRIYRQNRPVTYMGHPLFSCELFLAFYILKHLQYEIEKKNDEYFWFILCLTGCALSQGRIGTILIILSFLSFNLEWKKFRILLLGIVVIFIATYFGIFDSVINRMIEAISSGDVSAGRNSSIISLIKSGLLEFYPFKGQSVSYDGTVTLLGMALEYPILGWAYSFGYVVSFLMCIIIFAYPLIISLIRKQKNIFYSLLFLILDVNSYSGLSGNGDKPILFFVIICFILNISNYMVIYSKGCKLEEL